MNVIVQQGKIEVQNLSNTDIEVELYEKEYLIEKGGNINISR